MTTLHTPARNSVVRHITITSLVAASFLGLAACEKSDRNLTTEERLKAVQAKQETQPDFFVQRKTVDYMTDLRNIRETAQRPDKADPKAEPPTARTEPQRAQPAAPAPAPTPAPVTPAPAPVAAAPIVPAPVQPRLDPTPAPVAAAPAPAPAAARPAPSGDTSVTVVNREQPNFPREAIRQGVESGSVRARMSINAAGDVTNVTIISARPARVFEREVTSSLQRWKFNPGADGRSFETEISFQR
jgi:TonB family protein